MDHYALIKPSCHTRIQFSRQFFTDVVCPCRALRDSTGRMSGPQNRLLTCEIAKSESHSHHNNASELVKVVRPTGSRWAAGWAAAGACQ
eukprot:155768-Prorocentrum_minimum.AAC.2